MSITPIERPDSLTLAEAARIVREAMRDKSYQDLSLGKEDGS